MVIVEGMVTVRLKIDLGSYHARAEGLVNMVMVIVEGMDSATWVQILDETDCISHSTNTLGKGMNPIILPPAMGK